MYSLILDDTALANILFAGLELGFDKRDDIRLRCKPALDDRQQQSQRYKRSINYNQIDRISQFFEVARIGALHDDHPRILTQGVIQLTITHINCIDSRRTVLQQAVGKAPGTRAYIGTDTPSHV